MAPQLMCTTNDVLAQLGLKAMALAWLLMAWAFKM